MTTRLLKASPEAYAEGARLINAGEVVAFPTETVYGLGAHALNPDAVAKIFAAKGRPGDNPLIVHISRYEQIYGIISGDVPRQAELLAKEYWPGPMTMILPKGEKIPPCVTAGLDSVGVRLPASQAARDFISACAAPVAAPSANLSGKPSPTTAVHVLNDMNGRIPLIIDGGESDVGLESTVIDARSMPGRVLRPGGVTPQMIARVLGEVLVDGSVLRPLAKHETARSPGMKYKHYAPDGSLVIVKGTADAAAREINALYDNTEGSRCILAFEEHIPLYGERRVFSLGEDAQTASHRLFDALRQMDEMHINAIFSEAVPAEGLGLALMNRLGRAAAFHIIEV